MNSALLGSLSQQLFKFLKGMGESEGTNNVLPDLSVIALCFNAAGFFAFCLF